MNIFPEELETKLNNLPFILESLVIERNKKLVALVYADYEALDSLPPVSAAVCIRPAIRRAMDGSGKTARPVRSHPPWPYPTFRPQTALQTG